MHNEISMLELMLRPAFCVSDGKITKINKAADPFLLSEGLEIRPLLATGQEEYESFSSGCLYLTLMIGTRQIGATVIAQDQQQIFFLEQPSEKNELQSLALAAQQLREPLTGMLTTSKELMPSSSSDPVQLAQFNRRMYQALRIVSNMADAARFSQLGTERMEYVDICSFMAELLEKTAHMLSEAGIHLHYTIPEKEIFTLVDAAQLERAVYNMISNAAKHTATGGHIDVTLACRGRLYISVTDHGSGMDDGVKSSLFQRYLRQIALSDGADGIGLGMVLIRAAASAHGGTVLVDQPQGCGTRITMTLALQQKTNIPLRSPILRVDYAGERDHCLQELADVLPAHLYHPDNLG